MNPLRVLVGCEFSGIVRDAFKDRGHDAWSCDLLATEIEGQHLRMDIELSIRSQQWDLIILHLPCTAIALCGNSTYGKGMPKHEKRIESIDWTAYMWRLA